LNRQKQQDIDGLTIAEQNSIGDRDLGGTRKEIEMGGAENGGRKNERPEKEGPENA